MLTVADCRRLLGSRCAQSDADLQAVRDHLYALATVAVSAYSERARHLKTIRNAGGVVATSEILPAQPFNAALAQIPESERLQLEERAAILEYEAGLDRDRGERKAVADWLADEH